MTIEATARLVAPRERPVRASLVLLGALMLTGCAAGTPAPLTGPAVSPGPVDLGIDPSAPPTDVGLTWMEIEWASAPDEVIDIVTTGEGFLALGHHGGKDAVWLSPDGRTWERAPASPDLGPGGVALAAADERVVLLADRWPGDEDIGPEVGATAEMVAWWSDDGGRTWTQTDTTADHALGEVRPRCGEGEMEGVAGRVLEVVAGTGGFVATGLETVGRGFDPLGILRGDCDWELRTVQWHSPDGSSWDRVVTPGSFPSWSEVTLGANDERSVAFTSRNDGPSRAWSTTDGATWEESVVAAPPHQVTAIARLGTGFVAIGFESFGDQQAPRSWLSQDGTSWSPGGGLPEGMAIWGMRAGGPGLVALGWTGEHTRRTRDDRAVALTSVDGETWATSEPLSPPSTPTTHAMELFGQFRALAATPDRAVFTTGWEDKLSGSERATVWISPAGG